MGRKREYEITLVTGPEIEMEDLYRSYIDEEDCRNDVVVQNGPVIVVGGFTRQTEGRKTGREEIK